MKKILFCLSLSICILIPQVATALEATREGSVLRFTGGIDKESEKVILQHLRSGASTLIVNSVGGSAESGQAIAFEIIKQKANVIVDKYCFSACANYLFLAATEKSLLSGAVLGFHGGLFDKNEFAIKKGDNDEEKQGKKHFLKLFKNDSAQYKVLSIDHQILRDSYELTKGKLSPGTVSIHVNDETHNFSFEQRNELEKLIRDLKKEGKNFTFTVSRPSNQSLSKVYFPSKEALIKKYRVKGIANYPYPNNQEEMNTIAKEISNDLEVVGDF